MLRDRIRKSVIAKSHARDSKRAVGPNGKKHAPTLLPFAFLKELLKKEPIVVGLGLSENEVYDFVVGSFHDDAPSSETGSTARHRPIAAAPNACFECTGYIEIDHRNGARVCVDCGLVQDRGSLCVAETVDHDLAGCNDHQTLERHSGNRPSHVSYQVVDLLTTDADRRANLERRVQRDVRHWAPHVGISESASDAIVREVLQVVDAKGSNRKYDAILAGVMLRHKLHARPDDEQSNNTREEHIRSAIRKREHISFQWTHPTSNALQFRCSGCGAACGSRRGAKWHCRGVSSH